MFVNSSRIAILLMRPTLCRSKQAEVVMQKKFKINVTNQPIVAPPLFLRL